LFAIAFAQPAPPECAALQLAFYAPSDITPLEIAVGLQVLAALEEKGDNGQATNADLVATFAPNLDAERAAQIVSRAQARWATVRAIFCSWNATQRVTVTTCLSLFITSQQTDLETAQANLAIFTRDATGNLTEFRNNVVKAQQAIDAALDRCKNDAAVFAQEYLKFVGRLTQRVLWAVQVYGEVLTQRLDAIIHILTDSRAYLASLNACACNDAADCDATNAEKIRAGIAKIFLNDLHIARLNALAAQVREDVLADAAVLEQAKNDFINKARSFNQKITAFLAKFPADGTLRIPDNATLADFYSTLRVKIDLSSLQVRVVVVGGVHTVSFTVNIRSGYTVDQLRIDIRKWLLTRWLFGCQDQKDVVGPAKRVILNGEEFQQQTVSYVIAPGANTQAPNSGSFLGASLIIVLLSLFFHYQ